MNYLHYVPSLMRSALILLCIIHAVHSVKRSSSKRSNNNAYRLLAKSIQSRVNTRSPSSSSPSSETNHKKFDIDTIATALRSLSTSQAALKKIDGAAHEAYQRTHISSTNLATATASSASDDEHDNEKDSHSSSSGLGGLKVAGRMTRNAARLGCVADALLAAELCEFLALHPPGGREENKTMATLIEEKLRQDPEGTLAYSTSRRVVLNTTIYADSKDDYARNRKSATDDAYEKHDNMSLALSILVIYEPHYTGGAGIGHGGVDDLLSFSSNDNKENDDAENEQIEKTQQQKPRGRFLVILSTVTRNQTNLQLPQIIRTLDRSPQRLPLRSGLISNEVASVCKPLYQLAGKVLQVVGPIISTVQSEDDIEVNESESDKKEEGCISESEKDEEKTSVGESTKSRSKKNKNALPPSSDSTEEKALDKVSEKKSEKKSKNIAAIHFVGHSLAGGVAAIAANILDGSLPMPSIAEKSKGRIIKSTKTEETKHELNDKIDKQSTENDDEATKSEDDENAQTNNKTQSSSKTNQTPTKWSGYARARSSALCLGPPPCLSPNLKSAFVTSIIHGDDIVCRTTRTTIQTLCERTQKSIHGGLLTRSVGWMSDAVSLTISGLKSHAHGSEGEEGKLSVPGKVYLIRPRRMGGGSSSIHEVGGATGGREALRAAVLWQLNDILLSGSLWSHHELGAYIMSLDRVQLRGFTDGGTDESE